MILDYEKAKDAILRVMSGKVSTVTATRVVLALKEAATEAVEVVRRRECKQADYSGCADGMVYCMEHSCYMDENGYCSDGEREA